MNKKVLLIVMTGFIAIGALVYIVASNRFNSESTNGVAINRSDELTNEASITSELTNEASTTSELTSEHVEAENEVDENEVDRYKVDEYVAVIGEGGQEELYIDYSNENSHLTNTPKTNNIASDGYSEDEEDRPKIETVEEDSKNYSGIASTSSTPIGGINPSEITIYFNGEEVEFN